MALIPLVVLALAWVAVVGLPAPFRDDCEVRSDPETTTAAAAERYLVVAAHPAAAEAGCEVLAAGGSAADAAIAAQLVLGVVEPQSSGLGGGTIVTTRDADSGGIRVFDGLARSPARVTDGLRTPTPSDRRATGLDEFGGEVAITARAVGVPGTPAVLGLLHDRAGRLPWRDLFGSAVRLAGDGVEVAPYLHDVLVAPVAGRDRCDLADLAPWCDGDDPLPVGDTVVQPDLAAVLAELRDGGSDAFYDPDGTIAPAIIERLSAGTPTLDDDGPPVLPSLMTLDDMSSYRAVEREPLCADVVDHRVCGPPAPSSGGATVLEVLGLVERAGIGDTDPGSAARVHLAIEASRLAQVDRREHIGDPDLRPIPDDRLVTSDHLDDRATAIDPDRAGTDLQPSIRAPETDRRDGQAGPTTPSASPAPTAAPARSAVSPAPTAAPTATLTAPTGPRPATGPRPPTGLGPRPPTGLGPQRVDGVDDVDATTHLVVVDQSGNAVSMTSSINREFGAHVAARGIVLNDAQSNFTRLDSISRGERVNQMEPTKRPRTTMSPTIALDGRGDLVLAVGSAGGSAIPDHVAQAILGMLVDGLGPAEALAAGHWTGQGITGSCPDDIGARSEVEADSELVDLVDDLEDRGHPCARDIRLRSGTSAILVIGEDLLLGAADPRRDGLAVGD